MSSAAAPAWTWADKRGDSVLTTISTLLGGIGLFLVGMILMTDGLKSAAGSSLQRGLGSLTKGPAQSLAGGAGVTAA